MRELTYNERAQHQIITKKPVSDKRNRQVRFDAMNNDV